MKCTIITHVQGYQCCTKINASPINIPTYSIHLTTRACIIASYVNCLVLNTKYNIKNPFNFLKRLFSTHTICPLPRPPTSARWRPTAAMPHQQALCCLRCHLPGNNHVLWQNLGSISPWGPHGVGGQRHFSHGSADQVIVDAPLAKFRRCNSRA